MANIVSIGIGMKYSSVGLDKAYKDMASLEKESKALANTIQTSTAASAKKLGVELSNVGSILGTKVISQFDKFGKTSGQFVKLNNVFKDVNGTLLQQEQILKRVISQSRNPLTGRFQKQQQGFEVVSSGAIKRASEDKVFGQKPDNLFDDINVVKLAARAALTIPVWAALRIAIDGVTGVIPNAIQRFKELDAAAAEMQVLTQGGENIKNFSEEAMTAVNKLSKAMGFSVQEAKNFYTASAAAGETYSVSKDAMEILAQGAKATASDPGTFSKAIVLLVNNMGNSLTVAKTKVEQYQEAIATMHLVQKETNGSMNEMSEALMQSISTAAVANMSIDELVVGLGLLATAGRLAGPGGTSIKTSLDTVVQKSAEIQNDLGTFTPEEAEKPFLALVNIIRKLKGMTESGDSKAVQQWIADIFGIKAGIGTKSFLNSLDRLDELLAKNKSLKSSGDIDSVFSGVARDAKTQLDTLETQQKRLAEIWASMQSEFAGGVLGVKGDDAKDRFKALVNLMSDGADNAYRWGQNLKEVAGNTIFLVPKLALMGYNKFIKPNLKQNPGFPSESQLSDVPYGPELSSKQREMLAVTAKKLEFMQSARVKIRANKANSSVSDTSDESSGVVLFKERKEMFDREVASLEQLKLYGVDAIQIKERELVLARELWKVKGDQAEVTRTELELERLKLAERQKYADSLQSSIKDSLLGNLQGKGNNLFSDMSANFTSQLQESMATNLSSVIMSSGIGDVFGGAMGFLDEGARRITDPVVKAHDEGGKKVHDYIVAAWDKITGKQSAASGANGGAGMGTAGFSGGGNGLPGIWGSSAFTTQPSMVTSGPGRTSQGINVPSTSSPMGGGKPNFWGKAGAYGSIGAGTAITAAGGFQQMRGGGAKNFVGGAGQAGMAIGAGASGLLAMGAFGGVGAAATAGTAATGSFVAGSAASMLGVLGVVGLAIGAVLIIASMFMKGAKSTQTSTQTSETRTGSKIDISNKKLELINRNLLSLNNTMESFVLSSSSYFSEKSGGIDAQFALSGRRSMA